MAIVLADATVLDNATCVDDLIDFNGVLAGLLANIHRTRDPIVLNPDPAGTLKALFKFKISKKKEEDLEEEIKEDASEVSEELSESEEEDLEEEEEVEDDD